MRENTSLGVVIVDLDRFKNVNDHHGHLAGDAVLREAARRIQSGMRQYDSIGRYGGEEFLVLLPGCDAVDCLNQAERLRKLLAQADMRVRDAAISITASFGATAVPCALVHSPENVIRRADEALYLAKKMGRNRAEFLDYDAQTPIPEIAAEPETLIT